MPFFLLLVSASVGAEPIVVAVASNFLRPAEALATEFERTTGRTVAVSSGSTGKLYAQVTQGAPYDILLAADAERPALLEESGHGVSGTRFTYAIGALVLWSADPRLQGADCRAQLESLGSRHVAIANPLTAPYGIAALSFLQAIDLEESIRAQLVYGENIAQALHFVATGNASLGFVAASQLQGTRLPPTACRWPVPESLHAPIEQQAILLQAGVDLDAARNFLTFMRSEEGTAIIRSFGYSVPD